MLEGRRVGEVHKVAWDRSDPTLQVIRVRLRLERPLEIDAGARVAAGSSQVEVILSRGQDEPIPDLDGAIPIICNNDVRGRTC
jgi:hypothetical protein